MIAADHNKEIRTVMMIYSGSSASQDHDLKHKPREYRRTDVKNISSSYCTVPNSGISGFS